MVKEIKLLVAQHVENRVGKNQGFFAKTWQAGFLGFSTGFSTFLRWIVFSTGKCFFSIFIHVYLFETHLEIIG
jgi:hypothetical protein